MPDAKTNAASPARVKAASRAIEATTIIVTDTEPRKCTSCGIRIAGAWLCRTCLSWHWAATYIEAARNTIDRVAL